MGMCWSCTSICRLLIVLPLAKNINILFICRFCGFLFWVFLPGVSGIRGLFVFINIENCAAKTKQKVEEQAAAAVPAAGVVQMYIQSATNNICLTTPFLPSARF